MNKEFMFNIDNVFNIFTSKDLESIKKEYNINKYYELKQIHSNIVFIIDNNYKNNSPGDALITDKKNTPILIKTADCIPILIYDKEKEVIALVHSGWKGTLNIIIDKYNSKKENISVYLYPSIRKCHFEVKDDVYTKFKDKIINIEKYTTNKQNKYYIDLQAIIKDNLKQVGINNIYDSCICTYCHNKDFYSYRYNHTDKRNYLLVMIK